ncbi:hypothetical protein ACLVWU_01940 [Bdellovibrio sp. HCB290]|uniref:hypothetical protein n=1 Tax=Bdellovibrio sp. HCB290 TaxID=3394356 RepID=UPI0039B630D1
MMNTKQKIIIPVVVFLGLAAFSLFILKQRAGHVGNFPEDMPPYVPAAAGAGMSGFLPTSMESPERFEALNKNIKAMGECLDMTVQPLSAQDEFNFENVGKIIAPAMGAVLKVQTKWTAVDYKESGEVRRVFVDYSSDSNAPEAEPVKTVRHYVVLETGKVRDIRLNEALANNPSESEIQKLHAGGEMISATRALLVSYQNGDEINYVEKNGKAYSVVVSHLGKYFRCKDTDSANMTCSCN